MGHAVIAANEALTRLRTLENNDGMSMVGITVAGMTIPEIVAMKAERDALRPPLTAATIRECERQLEAVERKPDADGNIILKQNYRQVDNLGGYHTRCVHGHALSGECQACRRA